jgi:hypothetical protein
MTSAPIQSAIRMYSISISVFSKSSALCSFIQQQTEMNVVMIDNGIFPSNAVSIACFTASSFI